MAKSRKQQKIAKSAVANAAHTVKEAVVDAAKATTKVVHSYVVEPVKHILTPKKVKPVKKRHVRPPKGSMEAAPPPLARGRSNAARTMSAGLAKKVGGTTPSSVGAARPVGGPQTAGAASSSSEPTSTRSIRRQAKRRTMES